MTRIGQLAKQLVTSAAQANIMVTAAESCTGGMVTTALTDVAGASAVLDRGFVTYSNEAKIDLLGVREATLQAFGAVSSQTAAEMAAGALSAAPKCQLAVAITGIAGPGGGSLEKPVGLVWFGLARSGVAPVTEHHIFEGDREAIRLQAAERAIQLLSDATAGMNKS